MVIPVTRITERGDPLTDRQKVVFRFVRRKIKSGNPPTLSEIAEKCYPESELLAAKGAARQCLRSIENKGYITVVPMQPRGIKLTKQGREL